MRVFARKKIMEVIRLSFEIQEQHRNKERLGGAAAIALSMYVSTPPTLLTFPHCSGVGPMFGFLDRYYGVESESARVSSSRQSFKSLSLYVTNLFFNSCVCIDG